MNFTGFWKQGGEHVLKILRTWKYTHHTPEQKNIFAYVYMCNVSAIPLVIHTFEEKFAMTSSEQGAG